MALEDRTHRFLAIELPPILGSYKCVVIHKTTGLNVQVACRLDGTLAWISDVADGCRHDAFAMDESHVLVTMDPHNWIGDKGYVGHDMLTPIKEPPYRDLLEWEKEFNRQVNTIGAAPSASGRCGERAGQ